MNALLFDERLADALDDGNARRGWMMDLQRERSEEIDGFLERRGSRRFYDLGSGAAVVESAKCNSLDCEVCHA